MSYSIIFETKIVKLDDGRILHLDLSGCNNDNCGRDRADFTGKIYTKEAFQKYIDKFKDNDNDYTDALKIGSRWCSYNDYAKHLERMWKRAETWEQLSYNRLCEAEIFDGVRAYFNDSEEEKTLNPDEWNDICYDVMYRRIKASIRRLYHREKNIDKIVEALDNNKPMTFYIGRKRRR